MSRLLKTALDVERARRKIFYRLPHGLDETH